MHITDIQFETVTFQFEKPIKVAFGTLSDMDSLVVKVLTDEGLVGYGEAAPLPFVTGDDLETAALVGKQLREKLLGMEPRAIGAIHRTMDGLYNGNTAIKAGIDIACYDIMAKAAGVPLYKFLGGNDPHISTDITIGIDTPEEMASEAVRRVRQGFSILKIKLGEDIGTDAARMTAIRNAVGPEVSLKIDANQGWTVKDTLRIAPILEDLSVDLIEQPTPAWDHDGLKDIRTHTNLLLAADESCHSPKDAFRLCNERAVDVVNIKLMKCGGIYNALKIAAICEAAGVACMIGCMAESNLANVAGMHVAAAVDNIRDVDLDTVYLLKQDKVSGGFSHDGGHVTLWDEPGTGITIKEEP